MFQNGIQTAARAAITVKINVPQVGRVLWNLVVTCNNGAKSDVSPPRCGRMGLLGIRLWASVLRVTVRGVHSRNRERHADGNSFREP